MFWLQGVDIPNPEEGLRHLDILTGIFGKFVQDTLEDHGKAIADAEETHLKKVAKKTTELSKNYEKIVSLVKNCKNLVKQNEMLALKQASLAISLNELEKCDKM